MYLQFETVEKKIDACLVYIICILDHFLRTLLSLFYCLNVHLTSSNSRTILTSADVLPRSVHFNISAAHNFDIRRYVVSDILLMNDRVRAYTKQSLHLHEMHKQTRSNIHKTGDFTKT